MSFPQHSLVDLHMPRSFPASPWISFLRKYGPVPTNDNMYDEAIQRSLAGVDFSPIVLPSAYLDDLVRNFRSDEPKSVILTGTAGDGKTYHCREVYIALGGTLEQWNAGHMEQRLAVGQRQLVVVKDLSEMPERLHSKFVPVLAQDILKPNPRRIYLIAANHGQLLEQLDASLGHGAVRQLKDMVEEAMVTGVQPSASLMLYDMSKASALDVISKLLDQIILHPAWGGCESCRLKDASPRCPIRENRARLVMNEQQASLFRERLAALIELSELNNLHFPIRQLLALVTNMLLGHPGATDGLMTCHTAARVLDDGTHDQASIYANVFGENLRRRGEKTEPFSKLRKFGIGDEANNGIDSILVYGRDDHELKEHFTELVGCDPVYGATPTYLATQHAYLEGADAATTKAFLDQLRLARQRLFFVVPRESNAEHLLWDLTLFRFAGDFLSTAHYLQEAKKPERQLLSALVRGLNRMFTGALVEDQQQVVLASAGSHSQSRTSHIVDALISVQRKLGEEVTLGWEGDCIVLSVHLSTELLPVELPLTLLRFEFLCRVAEGALPSMFSRECYEDLLDFKARLYRSLQKRQHSEQLPEEEELIINFLELAPDGRVRQEPVVIKVP